MARNGPIPKVLHLPAGLAPMAPEKPIDMPQDVSDAWDWIVAECSSRGMLTTGDAMFVEAAARLWCRIVALEKLLHDDPLDRETNKLHLSNMRLWVTMAGKLGLNPMDRNRLLSCHIETEKADVDELLG